MTEDYIRMKIHWKRVVRSREGWKKIFALVKTDLRVVELSMNIKVKNPFINTEIAFSLPGIFTLGNFTKRIRSRMRSIEDNLGALD